MLITVAVLAPALGDALVVGFELGTSPEPGDGLDGRPPHEGASVLGDVTLVLGEIGLPVAGREPSPRTELLGAREARDVTDLGHEDGTDGLTHPEIFWTAW